VMGFAVNLQAVRHFGCQVPGVSGTYKIKAQRKYPDLARSRLRFADGSGGLFGSGLPNFNPIKSDV
jgi:hypothetical protein